MSVVVLLHGSGMSKRQWRRLADSLASTCEVVTPDFLGVGDNRPWIDDPTFDFHQDASAIARTIGGRRAHVVGHSYGGLVALTLARLAPQTIASLTVYDPVAFGVLHGAGDAEGLADLARAASLPIFADEARGGDEAWLEAFVDYWSGDGAWKVLPQTTRASFIEVGKKVYREVSSLMRDRTPASAYAEADPTLGRRTLLLGGETSPVAARRVIAQLANALRGAKDVTIPHAGHMGPVTHAEAVNALVKAHIERS